jgi:hypothetical protein
MPRGKKGKKSKGRRGAKQARDLSGPPASATSYNGPLTINVKSKDTDIVLVRLVTTGNLSSNALYSISSAYANNPNTSAEWSNYLNLYEEFRCVAQRLMYIPFYTNFGPTTTLHAPIVWSIDRNVAFVTPTTVNAAFQHSNARVRSTQSPVTIAVKASSSAEMLFQPMLSPAGTWQITAVAQSLAASTSYGVVFIEYLVQFRNRT